MCSKVPGITACEGIKNQGNRGFYAHTRDVARGNGRRNHFCWLKKEGKSTMKVTGGNYNVPANTKVGFNMGSVRQSTNYGNNSYPASNAFSNGSKFTHTNSGVGQWWEV